MSHKVKFGIGKAFVIVFEVSAATKGAPGVTDSKTFKDKPANCPVVHAQSPVGDEKQRGIPPWWPIYIEGVVSGGKEGLKQGGSSDAKKKKIVMALETNKERGVKRAYFKVVCSCLLFQFLYEYVGL